MKVEKNCSLKAQEFHHLQFFILWKGPGTQRVKMSPETLWAEEEAEHQVCAETRKSVLWSDESMFWFVVRRNRTDPDLWRMRLYQRPWLAEHQTKTSTDSKGSKVINQESVESWISVLRYNPTTTGSWLWKILALNDSQSNSLLKYWVIMVSAFCSTPWTGGNFGNSCSINKIWGVTEALLIGPWLPDHCDCGPGVTDAVKLKVNCTYITAHYSSSVASLHPWKCNPQKDKLRLIAHIIGEWVSLIYLQPQRMWDFWSTSVSQKSDDASPAHGRNKQTEEFSSGWKEWLWIWLQKR